MERSALPRKTYPDNPNVTELTSTYEVRTYGLSHYLDLLKPWHRWILICSVLAMILTWSSARFLMTHWYQAVAVLRPASQEPQTSLNLGSFLGSISGGSSGGIGNIFGTTAQDEQEMEAIFSSREFNLQLIKDNNLAPILLSHKPFLGTLTLRLFGGKMTSDTSLYRLILSRFQCDYSSTTGGNMVVSFIDPEPAVAKRILQLYIDRLLQRLRKRTKDSSEAAIEALQNQIARTSDALLVAQLDQLLAQQLQQVGTAEVQADFAFVVIDPPALPEVLYSPRPFLDALVAAVLVPLLTMGWVIGRDSLRRLL